MSWIVDAQCSRCKHRKSTKESCLDRPEIVKSQTALINKLNMEEPFEDGPGNGRIIVSCDDFAVA